MAQEHQEGNSVDLATHNMRRKRGRPRKDDISGSVPYSRARRRKVDVEVHENDPFVGQVVSGVLDGKFDAGYMLTVRVGERGSVLHGVVFEPGLSVPISAANDIAPNVKMLKRDEVSLPSAWQVPRCTPNRSRKDGVLRHRQSNESVVLAKGICADKIAEDLVVKVQMHSSVDIRMLPENDTIHAAGDLKQDFPSTIGDHASKDGKQNVQSTNASAECSRDIYVPEVGNPSVIASDRTRAVHLQEVVGEDTSIPQPSQTKSESKQAAISVGRPGSTSDNKSTNRQELDGNIKLNTQISQSASEPKRTVDTSDAGPVSTNDNKTTYFHEVVSDAKPVTELSQNKTSELKQSSETSDGGPVSKNGASEDYDKAQTPITVKASQQTETVADAKPVTEVPLTRTSKSRQSAGTSDSGSVFKNGASAGYAKEPPPVAIQTSVRITERATDATPVAVASETKTYESKQPAETSGSGPILSDGASQDYGKVTAPVTVQTSEPVTETADALSEAPHTIGLSVDESHIQHSVKFSLEDETVEVAERMNNSLGQEAHICFEPLGAESSKPVESSSELFMNNMLATEAIPEQLQCDPASNEAYSTAPIAATNVSSPGADVNVAS